MIKAVANINGITASDDLRAMTTIQTYGAYHIGSALHLTEKQLQRLIDLFNRPPAKAEAALEAGLQLAGDQTGFYRDLDMRGLAVIWAAIDPEKAVSVADRIYDPALKAWALREVASVTGDSSLYEQAAKSAREIEEPVDRARALREVAVYSGEQSLFTEALAILEAVDGAELAYALADLASASADSSIAIRIDPAYPDARALALYSVQEFDQAWTAAAEIEDPFDRAKAQSAIAGTWGNVDAANEIADPTLRDRALRDWALRLLRHSVALLRDRKTPVK